MLQKCIDLNHPVKELQVSVEKYLKTIKNLPQNTAFEISYCDVKFGGFIGNKSKTAIKNTRYLVEKFHTAFLNLNQTNRDVFITIFNQTNNVKILFANPTSALRLPNYPVGIRKESKALFLNLYKDTLNKYGIKDHYKKVFKEKKDSWCPFCGMEKYIHPNRQKQDYDHLLYKANYPVAAVNMFNLAPMGINCNRIYKKSKDLLADDVGTARSAVNPYFDVIEPRVNLDGSVMSRDPKKRIWKVNITPNSSEVTTWNSVFNISERCKEDFLDKMDKSKQIPEVDNLLYSFVIKSKARIQMLIKRGGHAPWNIQMLEDELELEKESYETNYYHEYNFIKYAVFEFLMKDECETYRKGLLKTILN
jgi:hypothetical protein